MMTEIRAHILSGFEPYLFARRQGDEVGSTLPSNWISSSQNFRWIIWEVARRLTLGKQDEVITSVIRGPKQWDEGKKGDQSFGFHATAHLLQRESSLAMHATSITGEVLWYGRIFGKDLFQTDIWTAQSVEPGFELPDYFLRPKKSKVAGGWLKNLIWDPWANDKYVNDNQKIQQRLNQLKGPGQ